MTSSLGLPEGPGKDALSAWDRLLRYGPLAASIVLVIAFIVVATRPRRAAVRPPDTAAAFAERVALERVARPPVRGEAPQKPEAAGYDWTDSNLTGVHLDVPRDGPSKLPAFIQEIDREIDEERIIQELRRMPPRVVANAPEGDGRDEPKGGVEGLKDGFKAMADSVERFFSIRR